MLTLCLMLLHVYFDKNHDFGLACVLRAYTCVYLCVHACVCVCVHACVCVSILVCKCLKGCMCQLLVHDSLTCMHTKMILKILNRQKM